MLSSYEIIITDIITAIAIINVIIYSTPVTVPCPLRCGDGVVVVVVVLFLVEVAVVVRTRSSSSESKSSSSSSVYGLYGTLYFSLSNKLSRSFVIIANPRARFTGLQHRVRVIGEYLTSGSKALLCKASST